MFIVSWFSTQGKQGIGNTGEVKYVLAESAKRRIAALKGRQDVIQVQLEGDGVDQGWERDGSGNWVEQYNRNAS